MTEYEHDIEEVFRIERGDENDLRPMPVLVMFSRDIIHDAVITKKATLQRIEGMDKVYINVDEPLHIRRAKAILRKAAYTSPPPNTFRMTITPLHQLTFIFNTLHTSLMTVTLPVK